MPSSATARPRRWSAAIGSIDWLCWPRFDSGACFAALLGGRRERPLAHRAGRGGRRSITRRYRDDTLILETDVRDRRAAPWR